MSPFATWNPGGNAVHRLIQIIDVLAIALNRARQLSFKLPAYRDAGYRTERDRLLEDDMAITHAVFPPADLAPQQHGPAWHWLPWRN